MLNQAIELLHDAFIDAVRTDPEVGRLNHDIAVTEMAALMVDLSRAFPRARFVLGFENGQGRISFSHPKKVFAAATHALHEIEAAERLVLAGTFFPTKLEIDAYIGGWKTGAKEVRELRERVQHLTEKVRRGEDGHPQYGVIPGFPGLIPLAGRFGRF